MTTRPSRTRIRPPRSHAAACHQRNDSSQSGAGPLMPRGSGSEPVKSATGVARLSDNGDRLGRICRDAAGLVAPDRVESGKGDGISVNCPACGVLNGREAAFCGGCGVALGILSPWWGPGPLPAGIAFCTACGTELARPGVLLERKIVSVVFVDLVGFTAMAEALDPEEVRRLLGPYYQRVREGLEGYAGTVEKFIGDAVMALFGAPVATEDDAERAVRAGYAVLQAVRRWPADVAAGALRVRIGIATGEAVVDVHARPQEGDATAHGDVVNTASRLQTGAPADGILVDERTYPATRFQIDFRQEPLLFAKGKAQPVPVWSVVQPRGRTGADPARHRRPLVGRAHETQVLIDALGRAVAGGEPQIVTLVGPPGIGKSRQVWQLAEHLEGETELVFWRQGRSLPYGDGVTFWALGEIVKAQAVILESDLADQAAAKLRRALADLVSDETEVQWLETHLRPLIGLGADEAGARAGDAFAAWRRFVEALAEQSPLVLVFEDLHWADDALLDFVDELVDRVTEVPLLVLATSRPELLERRPGWGGGKPNATTMSLAPLPDDVSARLVAALLDRPVPEAERQRALLAKIGGNPLYAEQYARGLIERGDLVDLPETVHGIIAARLDALSREEKSLLQDAAVVGTVFWLGAIEVTGGSVRRGIDEALHRLERKQFVQRARRSS